VASHTAVGVDDDLAAGEARVTLRSANDEAARGIDVILDLPVAEMVRDVRLDDFRSQSRSPLLRFSESARVSWCASRIGSGIRSSVSSVAYPNIMPWSPAPPVSTPMAMSGDWRPMVLITAQVW
jgi:hypothetical protein